MIKIPSRAIAVPFHFYSRFEPVYSLAGMQNTSKYWTSSIYVDLMICEGEKVNENPTGKRGNLYICWDSKCGGLRCGVNFHVGI